MPRAEVGSTKYISNRIKSKGLQRLRWFCQICQKQCRDENGFKCHTLSESHVRQMQLVGEDPRKYIQQYSDEFLRDFLQLLKTSHGEKQVQVNHFYQDYISNKLHIHMSATKWSSLTEFAKFLGREGICRVEEGEKGIFISWIDRSPEALRRQEAIRKREREERGDEEREQKMIEQQVRRAQMDKETSCGATKDGEEKEISRDLQRNEGEKIKLNFAPSKSMSEKSASSTPAADDRSGSSLPTNISTHASRSGSSTPVPQPGKLTVKVGAAPVNKPRNVFADMSKKGGLVKKRVETPAKPMTATERIMKEDMERKRAREMASSDGFHMKRQRVQ